MDIEQLTKSQIVLLTLLVSFVTSIATGIVSVSLLQQAPPSVTQTVNRVVEHTVERVVPKETQVATVITQEKTVTVKASDQIASAVSRARPSVVPVVSIGIDGKVGKVFTRGVAVSDHYVATDATGVLKNGSYALLSGTDTMPLTLVTIDKEHNVALFGASSTTTKLTAATLGTGAVNLGQTVIALTGTDALKVLDGIASAVDESTMEFETNVSKDTLTPGTAFTNTDGAIIGMYTGDASHIVPASALVTLVKGQDSTASTTPTTATSTSN